MGSFLPKIFNDIENTDIYKAALDRWGEASQVLMLVEETGEMLSAFSQFSRGRITLDELIEEMIDTLMLIDEMFYMLGVSAASRESILRQKMTLFRSRIAGDAKQKFSSARQKELDT